MVTLEWLNSRAILRAFRDLQLENIMKKCWKLVDMAVGVDGVPRVVVRVTSPA